MLVIRRSDCVPAPWKNGAGSTVELWREDDAAGTRIRISLAEITSDQPFSKFSGLDRLILQLDGPRVQLVVEGEHQDIAAPFAFPGEADVACRISGSGPAHVLNVMVRRGNYTQDMRVESIAAGTPVAFGERSAFTGLVCLGRLRLTGGQALARYDLLLFQGQHTLEVVQPGSFIRLTVDPVPRSRA